VRTYRVAVEGLLRLGHVVSVRSARLWQRHGECVTIANKHTLRVKLLVWPRKRLPPTALLFLWLLPVLGCSLHHFHVAVTGPCFPVL